MGKWLLLSTLLVFACGGTSGTSTDMVTLSSNDLAGGPADLASSGDAGLLALCANCTSGSQCFSGMCVPYMMGAGMRCSHSCAAATASTDCPGLNQCNGMNYCKCP
jgi:hypothetical protein